MLKIPISKGYEVLVDDEDFISLIRTKWSARMDHSGNVYAYRSYRLMGKMKSMPMHRQILGLIPNDCREVDHMNGNSLDNRKQNLRFCDRSQNNCNRGMRSDNTSGIKGVSRNIGNKRNPWQAQIMHHKKAYNLGSYSTKEEAAEAYRIAAVRFHGDFARII